MVNGKKMLKGRRVKRKTTSKPLTLRNPFSSTSYNKYKLNREFVGPVKGRYGDPVTKLGIDQERLKKMQKFGLIPDTLGVQMRQYTGNTSATSQGVSSLQALSDEQDLARQVQMFNAGILSKKQQKLKSLLELAKKKKKYDFDKKVVEWLATAKEIEQIPPELIEDVRKYWQNDARENQDKKTDAEIEAYVNKEMERVAGERREYARKKLEEKERKGKLRGFFEQPRFNTLQPSTATSLRYTDNNGLLTTAAPPVYTPEQRRKIWEIHRNDDNMFDRARAFIIFTSGMSDQDRANAARVYSETFKPNNADMERQFWDAVRTLAGDVEFLPSHHRPPSQPPPRPPHRPPSQPPPLPPQRGRPENPFDEVVTNLLETPALGLNQLIALSNEGQKMVMYKVATLSKAAVDQIQEMLVRHGLDLVVDFGFDKTLFDKEQNTIQHMINNIVTDLQKMKAYISPKEKLNYYLELVAKLTNYFTSSQIAQILRSVVEKRPEAGKDLTDNYWHLNAISALQSKRLDKDLIREIEWFYKKYGEEDPSVMNEMIFQHINGLQEKDKRWILNELPTEIKEWYNIFYPDETPDPSATTTTTTTTTTVPTTTTTVVPSTTTTVVPTTSVDDDDGEMSDTPRREAGSGYLGWRAPRLHRLVRPYRPFMLTETPEEIVDEEKHDLDERRAMYKDQQLFQRGLAPPKDMVDRAMPKTAKPYLHNPLSIPFTGVIPHPFVFPDKKYFIRPGL